METNSHDIVSVPNQDTVPVVTAGVDHGVTEISSLLRSLDESAASAGRSSSGLSSHDNQLVQVRLGIASSLFTALGCKHAASSAHSLRVAVGCSTWTQAIGLPDEQRDQLEVAALLHDIGKIGVPDHILQKPGNLTPDEAEIMASHREMGLHILSCCCGDAEILEIVKYAPAWYDGSKPGYDKQGQDIPVGARIMAIVDAFDAMTTDHVYRQALSRERALLELFQFAGAQFDPQLVEQFSQLHEASQLNLHSKVSQRWLETLAPDLANRQWELSEPTSRPGHALPQTLFQQKLLDNMHDGMVYVDAQRRVFQWNRGAERLTGISADAVYQRTWLPSVLKLRDEKSRLVPDEECPVAAALLTGSQSRKRMTIAGRDNARTSIYLHVIPVVGNDGATHGATIVMHDASSETSLEERCQSLHSRATKDPLTGVANRAEFDRVHAKFIETHVKAKLPYSLIIGDIDHFKQVNDTYGHQAGDDALQSVAALLRAHCKHGDLVARYGGEEFVLLCADCNNAAGASRAEEIRRAMAETPQPMLGGKRITASFGVTENQPGDTPESMLRRADRALLQAKSTGRNRVVQLGTGVGEISEMRQKGWWPFSIGGQESLVDRNLLTRVPLTVAIEKLRGFVADHDAHITSTRDDQVTLSVTGMGGAQLRRTNDRPVPLIVELQFGEGLVPTGNAHGQARGETAETCIRVTIRPKRSRDRRQGYTLDRARDLFASLKSYLMAVDEPVSHETVLGKARKAIFPRRRR